jgi:orotidine-5'-phosphate decarboxylase
MNKYALALVLSLAAASSVSAQQLSMSQKLQIRDDCGDDFRKLCPGLRPGGGQLMGCVQSKKDQLSKVCSETLAKLMPRKPD